MAPNVVRILAPAPIAVRVRTAQEDRCAVVDHCAAPVPNAVEDRSVETRRAVVGRVVAAVRTAVSRHAALVRSEALPDAAHCAAQSVVIPCGVRVVTQKDGDRSVQADLHVEAVRSVRVLIRFVSVVSLSHAEDRSRFLVVLVRASHLQVAKVARCGRGVAHLAAPVARLRPTAAPQLSVH